MSKSLSKSNKNGAYPHVVVGDPLYNGSSKGAQSSGKTDEETGISILLWEKFAEVYNRPLPGFQGKNVTFPTLSFHVGESTIDCLIIIHATQPISYAEFQISTSMKLPFRPKYYPLSQNFIYSATTPSMASSLLKHVEPYAIYTTTELSEFVCKVLRCHNGADTTP